jgi:hypothetical protein
MMGPGPMFMPGFMRPQMHHMPPQPMAKPQEAASVKALSKQSQLSEQAPAIINQLESIDNPKFKDSEYLQFMKKIDAGALQIDGNDVVENEEKM